MSGGRVRPSAWRTVITNFVNSLRKAPPREFIGEDYLGNRYYEQPTPYSSNRKLARSLEPANRHKYHFEHDARWEEIPPEWEAWLRNKRKDPPTAEEIQQNIALMLQKQANGARLEAERRQQLASASERLPVPAPVDSDAPVPFPGTMILMLVPHKIAPKLSQSIMPLFEIEQFVDMTPRRAGSFCAGPVWELKRRTIFEQFKWLYGFSSSLWSVLGAAYCSERCAII
ncbi:NADH dehydrogenase [ubiquinone] 1 alpha subcomplex assembly factor 2-like [Paramacrobiotus metropolitanus]|uniref:NADH dehydrogenase [ubiquinone] 1 alpha subcomplex assembly factor 2-like n=1 Tax=Paramacrobiotus metropolitanus TaxID=2943436 RepID=UPI0024456CBC|nr:NADH dehydrogenase [ubiquinone] 1 alpha subcomplex assembly factor 2-like [Paramacrobiotus metropolitanus]